LSEQHFDRCQQQQQNKHKQQKGGKEVWVGQEGERNNDEEEERDSGKSEVRLCYVVLRVDLTHGYTNTQIHNRIDAYTYTYKHTYKHTYIQKPAVVLSSADPSDRNYDAMLAHLALLTQERAQATLNDAVAVLCHHSIRDGDSAHRGNGGEGADGGGGGCGKRNRGRDTEL